MKMTKLILTVGLIGFVSMSQAADEQNQRKDQARKLTIEQVTGFGSGTGMGAGGGFGSASSISGSGTGIGGGSGSGSGSQTFGGRHNSAAVDRLWSVIHQSDRQHRLKSYSDRSSVQYFHQSDW